MAADPLIPWRRRAGELVRRGADPFAALRQEMDELIESFLGPSGLPGGMDRFTPRIDVNETDKEVRVRAEVPGMEEKDIEVSLSGNTLVLKGEKKTEKEEEGEDRYYAERSWGAFRRSIPLPAEVNVDKAKASFKNGVLTIKLPKSPAAQKARKISISKA